MVSRREILHRVPERVAAGRTALLERGWLALTPADFQEAVLGLGIWKTARAGTQISRPDDCEAGLIGIAAGIAELSIESGHPDTRLVGLAHVGLWAGYRPLLGKARNAGITAQTDLLWVLVPQRAMERLLREHPQYWRHIAMLCDSAYELAVQIMVDLTRQNGVVRVAATLLRLAGCRQAEIMPRGTQNINLSQADIAAVAVMSRNTAGAYLAELARMGLIDVSYRSVRITDVAGLHRLLDAEE